MLYETEELPEKCERQVFFNSNLHVIATVERPDKIYVDPINFLGSSEFRPPVPMTYENASDYIPFLEVKIFIRPGGSLRYRVSFESDEELDAPAWRKVMNAVNEALQKFSKDRSGVDGQNLFLPREKDKTTEEKETDTQARLEGAKKVKDLYSSIQEELRKMHKAGTNPTDIARHFGIAEETGKVHLQAERPHYADLAKEIVLSVMKKEGLDKTLRIYTLERLDDEILNRDLGNVFPKLKKVTVSRRPRFIGANDAVPK